MRMKWVMMHKPLTTEVSHPTCCKGLALISEFILSWGEWGERVPGKGLAQGRGVFDRCSWVSLYYCGYCCFSVSLWSYWKFPVAEGRKWMQSLTVWLGKSCPQRWSSQCSSGTGFKDDKKQRGMERSESPAQGETAEGTENVWSREGKTEKKHKMLSPSKQKLMKCHFL